MNIVGHVAILCLLPTLALLGMMMGYIILAVLGDAFVTARASAQSAWKRSQNFAGNLAAAWAVPDSANDGVVVPALARPSRIA